MYASRTYFLYNVNTPETPVKFRLAARFTKIINIYTVFLCVRIGSVVSAGILRNPDRTRTRTRTRTRRKSGLEKNPDPDSKKIRTRV